MAYNDRREHLETRHDTTERQREPGRVATRYAEHSVLGRSMDCLWWDCPSLLGFAVGRDFKAGGGTGFTGSHISHALDLAARLAPTVTRKNRLTGSEKKIAVLLKERFGHDIQQELGINPGALTAAEAGYLVGFRDADSLRARVASAIRERSGRLRAKGVSVLESSRPLASNGNYLDELKAGVAQTLKAGGYAPRDRATASNLTSGGHTRRAIIGRGILAPRRS